MNTDRAIYERGQMVGRGLIHAIVTLVGLFFQITWIGYRGESALLLAISSTATVVRGDSISLGSWVLTIGVVSILFCLLLSFAPGRIGRAALIGSLFATALVIVAAASTSGGSSLVLASSIPLGFGGWIGWWRLNRLWRPPRPAGICQRCGYLLEGLPAYAACPECGQLGGGEG